MEELANIPWKLIWPLIGIQLILIVVALVDLFRNRNVKGPLFLWILIIVFINIIGPVIYFLFGRRQS
ncbi:PLDc N-terminal domain-containing protein [Aciduricibacillus chroicocephali]|uniref:PLDc N-terminal domain-containing protein n=1 Tax=Aciduricibacillus chroicocephali TaxID=3054939 RepID=A0ABY9KVN7_9BACI|nr:PLDc N-terminal domain-containing protein [Bacillaceae bacterium 44XB]